MAALCKRCSRALAPGVGVCDLTLILKYKYNAPAYAASCCTRPRGEFRAEKSLQPISSLGGSSLVLPDVCPGSAPHM